MHKRTSSSGFYEVYGAPLKHTHGSLLKSVILDHFKGQESQLISKYRRDSAVPFPIHSSLISVRDPSRKQHYEHNIDITTLKQYMEPVL